MHENKGVVGSKVDEMGVKSSGLVQMEFMCPMLGAALTIKSSPQNSSKGASLRYGLTKISSFDQASESSSITLT